jgi:class 3 adenylate cyclase
MYSGTVTFLFTDIEDSTKQWARNPDAMSLALACHDEALREAIERNRGNIFKRMGDAFCAAFATAPDALNAALEAHLDLMKHEWGESGPIRVRIALHTGIAVERDDDYYGPTVNRVARILAIGHGQQTLLSRTTYELVRDFLPPGTSLGDLGNHLLKDLANREHVWQLRHPSLPDKFPPLNSLDYLATNLPLQATSFVGRNKELVEIRQALGRTRLLTLTGSGGTGKTRLSLQTGADVLDQYPDGVWFVALASLSDSDRVTQTIAETLRIREARDESILDTLIRSLEDKQMLLILDNCEHVVEAVALLVDAVLAGCPKMKILATSRETLGIAWEKNYRVPSMSVPGLQHPQTPESVGDYESARLFLERAAGGGSDFVVTPGNAAALARICRRLDGIPLAIELAAARVSTMTVEMIEARLDDLFRLLTEGSRTALPRQRTLLATIDWSYDLLEEPEKLILRRLSVFRGGWRFTGKTHKYQKHFSFFLFTRNSEEMD